MFSEPPARESANDDPFTANASPAWQPAADDSAFSSNGGPANTDARVNLDNAEPG